MKTKLLIVLVFYTLNLFSRTHSIPKETTTNPTDSTFISDLNFENKLIELGFDSGIPNGKVLTANIASITTLDVSGSSIADLTGIESFIALQVLNCSSNVLEFLNLSQNTALRNLNCSDNSLSFLDVSQNVLLSNLNCSLNKLTGLDISKNTNLDVLRCGSNEITLLDVSKNLLLNDLYCASNELIALDVSKNSLLAILYCNSNKLLYLNLKNGNNPNFDSAQIDFTENENLSCIQVDDVTYSNTNWADATDTATYDTTCTLYTYIPDLNFERKLIAANLDSGIPDKLVIRSNINTISELDVYNSSISDLTGIEDFVALTQLDCSSNQLTDLDLSQNINLTNLDCSSNQLTVLNINSNTALTDLECHTNQITSLDVSQNSSLINLDCHSNPFTAALNISQNVNLTHLNCNSNQLTVLDINSNTALTDLECHTNQLTSLDVSQNSSLINLDCHSNPFTTALNISQNVNLTHLNCSYNQLTALDVTSNVALTDLTCSNNQLTELNVSMNSNLENLNCSSNQITELNSSLNNELAFFNCSSNLLNTLNVNANPKLINLNCSTNQLTTLELSSNIALLGLYCSSNLLTTLDVSKNVDLIDFDCHSNTLTNLDLSHNPRLTDLKCYDNKLAALNISQNGILMAVRCYKNELTALDVTHNPVLNHLECYDNHLTSLDVSQNIALIRLNCSLNALATLDVSKNTILTSLFCNSNYLTSLNLKNGNNNRFNAAGIDFKDNNLTCIEVDNVAYSTARWANFKDNITAYNRVCIPAGNFTVESKGESCVDLNNGEINITASADYPYLAKINEVDYSFTDKSVKVSNLAPGTYQIVISIAGETFTQNFTVLIPEATPVTGKSSVFDTKITVDITQGTAPYTIFVDGVAQFETATSHFTVDLKDGKLLEVKTAKACEGVYTKEGNLREGLVLVYPNPTDSRFEILLPTSKRETSISLYTTDGRLISNKIYPIEDGKVQVTLEGQPTGVYIAKIELDVPTYSKIIKN